MFSSEPCYLLPVLVLYLEVEDSGVLSVLEALSVRDNSSQNFLIQGQRGDGGEQPAVT